MCIELRILTGGQPPCATDEDGNDIMDEMVKENYINIKNDVKQIVSDELERIANDVNLCHLLNKK